MESPSDRHLPDLGAGEAPPCAAGLHVCPACSSTLVQPLEWTPAGPAHWRVELRCPECEWRHAGRFEQRLLDAYDRELNDGTDAIVDDLRILERSNMEDALSRFGVALGDDRIFPEDF